MPSFLSWIGYGETHLYFAYLQVHTVLMNHLELQKVEFSVHISFYTSSISVVFGRMLDEISFNFYSNFVASLGYGDHAQRECIVRMWSTYYDSAYSCSICFSSTLVRRELFLHVYQNYVIVHWICWYLMLCCLMLNRTVLFFILLYFLMLCLHEKNHV